MKVKQTQKEMDLELAELMGISVKEVECHLIAGKKSIQIHKGSEIPSDDEDTTNLYKDFSFIDWIGYLRTLMYTSIHRRGNLIPFLKQQKNKKCLDYGCGVGSHSIVLAELGNDITILDVKGKALDFVCKRLKRRNIKFDFLDEQSELPKNKYDVVICIETLEHVFNPASVLRKIYLSLKKGGLFYLRYSKKIKNSSGHFPENIKKTNKSWKKMLSEGKFKPLKRCVFRKEI